MPLVTSNIYRKIVKQCIHLQQQTRELSCLSLLIYKVSSNLDKCLMLYHQIFTDVQIISAQSSPTSLSLPQVSFFQIDYISHFVIVVVVIIIIIIIINADFVFRNTLPKYSN